MANTVFYSSFRTFSSVFGKTNAIKCVNRLTSTAPSVLPSINFIKNDLQCATNNQQQIRHSSFRSSYPIVDVDIDKAYPQIDIIKNPPEWKFVERILSKPLIPEPTVKSEYPSGWRPQQISDPDKIPYFIPRTKNHMIPVYLNKTFRNHRLVTKLRYIQGDIWQLEKELHDVIEKRANRKIATRVNELSGQIWFHGDYVTIIQDYLMEKGL